MQLSIGIFYYLSSIIIIYNRIGPEAVVSIITSSAIDNILSNSLDSGSFIDIDPSVVTPQREALACALAFTVLDIT